MLYVNEYCFDKALCTRLLKKEFKLELTNGPLIGHGNTPKELVYDFLVLCLLCQSFPYYDCVGAQFGLSKTREIHLKHAQIVNTLTRFSSLRILPSTAILNKPMSTRLNMSGVCQQFLVIYKRTASVFTHRINQNN